MYYLIHQEPLKFEPPSDGSLGGDDGNTLLDSTVIRGKTSSKYFVDDGKGNLTPVQYSFIKIIKTNYHVEIHEAEYPYILQRQPKFGGRKNRKNKRSSRNLEYRERNAKRTKDRIRRLSYGNFRYEDTKHLVLTFEDTEEFDIRDIGVCNKKFNEFAKKLRKIDKNYKYIKVAEFQDARDRGAVHYHVMCTLPFTESLEIERLWGHGFIRINRAPYDISKYLFKYISKNAGDFRYRDKRSWSHSKNLVPSKFLYQSQAYGFRKMLSDTNVKSYYTYSYKTEYNGKVIVYEYDLEHPEECGSFNFAPKNKDE